LREMEKMKVQHVDAQELSSAKEQLKGNMLLSAESTDNRMSRLAKCEIYYNKYLPLEEIVAEIDKVTTAGGITIKGLNEMEHAGFTSTVIRGLKASYLG